MKELCKKCNGKYGEAFPYHKWPQQWYHGGGKTIFLCNHCKKLLEEDKEYSLHEVLCTPLCENRINNFLQKEYFS
ncbi:hypothetical protein COX93_00525 [Candidatus Nomurabacteria bacterium CG_4_10_14_0_2_um_filter_30_12]|uniref:Uncharacterized protein n=2 Tax=Candidatus Nomuraibacteriota TaxID=1752729 RepID=A0A2J0MI21_9BACT|nr:MAG: hypothetical protein COU48_01520 [Candidatus Nomurabacteria bacterium CG10_big_fil_rev_8_21_14_0_10_03_31_7]PIZ87593.1 MAG: hypothetical protein COX93_00525 [Candidatus Nomurabacteria bacterium CG_4_10_14_0_2_um_filter_30_12]